MNRTARYALRAATYLALRDEPGAAIPLGDIADATGIPRPYLSKVLQQLARHGLVQAQRGARGGYALGRPAATITLLEILRATEPAEAVPVDREPVDDGLGALESRLDALCEVFDRGLGETTLAGLVQPRASNGKGRRR